MSRVNIPGYCPMGCGETLVAASENFITCMFLGCPRPDAVSELLSDRESEHIVQFTGDAFTVRHPLRERLDDALMSCELREFISGLGGPPVRPGRYRATLHAERWHWSAVSS